MNEWHGIVQTAGATVGATRESSAATSMPREVWCRVCPTVARTAVQICPIWGLERSLEVLDTIEFISPRPQIRIPEVVFIPRINRLNASFDVGYRATSGMEISDLRETP